MKLERRDYEFNNPRICHIQPKHIELDRALINLYMLLKYDGKRPVARSGRKEVTVGFILESLMQQHGKDLQGFSEHPDIVKDWLHSDLLDIVYRGIPEKEKIASPLPLHLNAYKLRNPTIAKDYRGAEHLYSMLLAADPALVQRLKEFLGRGMDPTGGYDMYDGETSLDLDTMMIVRMVDSPELKEDPSGERSTPEAPLCRGQARLFCDDLRRLLAYERYVPRSVMISYLRTAVGFHLGLYLVRLFQEMSGWVRDRSANPVCLICPVKPNENHYFSECPYAFQNESAYKPEVATELIVDMGEDHTSQMASISMANCAAVYETMNDYIHAVFTTNQLFQFAGTRSYQSKATEPIPQKVEQVLRLFQGPSHQMDFHFQNRIDSLFPEGMDNESPEVKAILEMNELTPIETFVELVALERIYNYRRELTRQIDSVLMKNQDTCLLRQGKGKSNRRRWYIGSRLLEFLVQIAVIDPVGEGANAHFVSRPILIDDFIKWLRDRYGLVIIPEWPDARVEDNKAFNENLQNLKRRLREIGFYTDLSDAYNTQTIRPRYQIKGSEQLP